MLRWTWSSWMRQRDEADPGASIACMLEPPVFFVALSSPITVFLSFFIQPGKRETGSHLTTTITLTPLRRISASPALRDKDEDSFPQLERGSQHQHHQT